MLLQLQREFSSQIRTRSPSDLDPRMRVYGRAYRLRFEASLKEDFPILARILGELRFSELVAEFLETVGSQHSSLAELGKPFQAFLESRSDFSDLPWLLDVARYEWMKIICSLAPEPELTFSEPKLDERSVPILSPSLSIWQGEFPVHLLEDPEARLPEARAVFVLIWKVQDEIQNKEITLQDLDLIKLMQKGSTILELSQYGADAGHGSAEFQALFSGLFSERIIVGWSACSALQRVGD
jgi:hypothetical protein